MAGIHNPVKSHLPSCTGSRIEIEGATDLRDVSITTEEKIVAKGENKTDIGDSQAVGPSVTVKMKLPETQRTCSSNVLDSSTDFRYSCRADRSSEHSRNTIKSPYLSVANSTIPMTSTTSSSKISYLLSQRPPSILRTSMVDLRPPVSNSDGFPQCFLKSEVGVWSSCGTGGSLLVGSVDVYNHKRNIEFANYSSPPALYEGEESGYRENNPNVTRTDAGKTVSKASVKAAVSKDSTRKKKVLVKQGMRSTVKSPGKMSLAKSSVTQSMENIENIPANRLHQSVRHSLDKDRSMSGRRPSTKPMIPKTSSHSEHVRNSCFPDSAGELDDYEELIVAATSACNASYRACSSSFWKKMECYFAPLTLQDESYLKHQLDFTEELSGSLLQMPGNENNDLDDLKLQQDPLYSGEEQEHTANKQSNETAAICGGIGVTHTFAGAPSLCQRVLSAIIEEDESEEMTIEHDGRNDFHCASDNSHCGSSSTGINRSVCSSVCTSEHWQADNGLSYYAGPVPQIFHNDLGSSLNSSPISSSDCNYHMLSLDDKILLELQSIGLCPEMMPRQAGEETIRIDEEIMELQARLFQQAGRITKSIRKIYEAISYVKESDKRNVEQAAMCKLTEMAYKKQMVSRRNASSKGVLRKISKQVALPFAERTLARCRKFEDTGKSCFSEATLQSIMFSKLACKSDQDHVDCVDSRSACKRSLNHNLDIMGSDSLVKQHYGDNSDGPILKMEMNAVLLNNVGSVPSRALSIGSLKQKRTEGPKDQTIMLTDNYVPSISHPPVGSSQAVHISEATPMQKATYSLALEDGPGSIFSEPASNELPAALGLPMNSVNDVIRTNMEQNNVEIKKDLPNTSAEQLTELGSFEHEDYSSLFDIDVDGLQNQDSLGLDIPMDNLPDIGADTPMDDLPDIGLDTPMDDLWDVNWCV